MEEYIKKDDALAFPFANGQYDHENADEHFIFGCETYKEWLEQIPAADVVERTLFDERMAEYQEALDKANEKLAYITGTDDYHYDLEYGREQLNSYVSALVYEKTQKRKKGKWTLNKDGSGTCSECGRRQNNCWDADNWDNFCHFCGADMREGS